MRRVTPVFAVIFAVLLAAPASAQRNRDRDQDRDQGPRETENVDRTLSLAPGGTVRLKTFSGRVTITGTGGSQVVIKAVRRASRERLNDIKLEITQNGNVVEIDANHRIVERRNDNVVETDFDIQLPSQTKLDLRTFSAPITVTGVTGDMTVDGFSSEIRLDQRRRSQTDQDLQRSGTGSVGPVGGRRRSQRRNVQRRRHAAPARGRARRHQLRQLQRHVPQRSAGHDVNEQPADVPRIAQRRRQHRLQAQDVQRRRSTSASRSRLRTGEFDDLSDLKAAGQVARSR